MWLIDTTTLRLRNFQGKPPPYAILSHRWGNDDEEVTFQEWRDDHSRISLKPGFVKISKACIQAKRDRLNFLWVDTNCIDKSSSAELSEAINSMYRYYSEAVVCYAHLYDVHDGSTPTQLPSGTDGNIQFSRSTWFTRGWTLQELLAPTDLVFFNSSWSRIGTKAQLEDTIATITGIPPRYLHRPHLRDATISCRMSWVSNRVTTRLEDIAYCMLGIFNINMPLLYGEGRRAFQRLQEELVKSSDDRTIFAWDWLPRFAVTGRDNPNFPNLRAAHLVDSGWDVQPMYTGEAIDFYQYKDAPDISSGATSLLAPDPVFFYASNNIATHPDPDAPESNLGRVNISTPYFITNKGLSITLPLLDPSAHAVRPRTLTSRRWGDPQPLAMISAQRHTSSFIQGQLAEVPSDICQGVAIFLKAADREASTYDRAVEPDELGHDSVSMFRGHLMHVTMPWDWFRKYFCDTPMFVPSSGKLQSIFAWDQAPDAAVWLLNDFKTQDTVRIELFLGAGPLKYRPDHWSLFPSLLEKSIACIGAIYKITTIFSERRLLRGKREVTHEACVIVRAYGGYAANPDSTKVALRWSCDAIFPSSRGAPVTAQDRASRVSVLWDFGGTTGMTLHQILNCRADQYPQSGSLFVESTASQLILLGQRKVMVRLGGSGRWVTNPASSMKFLCAEMIED
ncbi:heterokaryon incompatibility protein-domain-containing protein [Cercophora newfieldiana]|uniref:Heterokaryon incompatibility protein-domain-containing protein n=1 Tax=Cercophora newfieldiana TaxID=92897 RepID=A0AA39YNR3_9PEZI|nr:heterokaryon incompatibility protein-domain-containing protein [Cercophora newfieldiana]